MSKQRTITFQPEMDVKSLLKKEMNRIGGMANRKRGLRTRLINEAIRQAFKGNMGKREANARIA